MAKFDGTFEHHAEVGDYIRAWDFERFPDRADRWVEGRVIAKGITPILRDEEGFPYGGGYCGFTIMVTEDITQPAYSEYSRVGHEVYVPYDNFCDFDYRVEKIG